MLKIFCLTLIIQGGAKWPTAYLIDYISATECPIGLKPSCIFKFVRCPEVYEKKLILDRGGTVEGLLSARVPQNQPCRVNLWSIWGSMKVHEGSLNLGEVQQWP